MSMTAAELFDVVKDVPREAWPELEWTSASWRDSSRWRMRPEVAEAAFIGSMTAWRIADAKNHGGDVYIEQDKHGFRVQVNDIEYRASSLVAALAAACKEAA